MWLRCRRPAGGRRRIESLPIVLIPGLLLSARLWSEQLPALWRLGPVMIADHTRDDSMEGIAGRVLAAAPPRFALVGLSMGGYIAFEIMRRAADRVARLTLLDTTARPDTPALRERRRRQIAIAERGRFESIADLQFPLLVHRSRQEEAGLRELVRLMAGETGPEAFVREQTAIMNRPDSRPDLAAIACPTLVLVGDGDRITPPEWAAELAAGIAGARHVVVPECGHLSPIERPREVTRALVEWLGEPGVEHEPVVDFGERNRQRGRGNHE
jgi:pimeloyl-ACP methyl ester carboxylesterase